MDAAAFVIDVEQRRDIFLLMGGGAALGLGDDGGAFGARSCEVRITGGGRRPGGATSLHRLLDGGVGSTMARPDAVEMNGNGRLWLRPVFSAAMRGEGRDDSP